MIFVIKAVKVQLFLFLTRFCRVSPVKLWTWFSLGLQLHTWRHV